MTHDALLAALADARQRKEQAARDTRLLLAFAREIITPRPYRLADLAKATGLSISGIRTAYAQADIQQAEQILGGIEGCGYRQHLQAATAALTVPAGHLSRSAPPIP
jgi:hypothetical protein